MKSSVALLSLGAAAAAAAASWPMVGWDAYRSYDMYRLRPGEETHQFSSYDRQDHNDDGFDGTYSCLRQADSRCVIAEYNGTGEVASIWFTYEPDSVQPIGDIIVTLDGKDVLSGDLQDIVNSAHGAPFTWPFVGNTNDTNGGNVIKVPMPFSKTMLITTQNNPHFYHVTYRRFPAQEKPKTFDPADKAADVASAYARFGVADPKPGGARTGRHVSSRLAGQSGSYSLSTGCGLVSHLALRFANIPPTAYAYDDGRAFAPGGSSSFSMRVDSQNKQCRLTRRIDRSIAGQKVEVRVDGHKIGTLNSGTAANATWADQSLDIPSSVTAWKSAVDVKVSCVSSSLDCNEFFYAMHCTSRSGHWDAPGLMPGSDWTLMDLLNVGWNNPHDEAAHKYAIAKQTWQGLRQYKYNDSAHTDAALPDIRITLAFDGKETVSQVPIGPFFGSGLAKSMTRSLMHSVDPFVSNGAWSTFFPMPFHKTVSVKLSSADGSHIDATIDAIIQPCRQSSSPWGHFSVQHRRADTTPGQLWPFLSSKGPGVAYGVTHTFRGSILQPANTLEFLEGDEQIWLNRTTPGGFNDSTVTMLGTGTEDFYESGWYFNDVNTSPSAVTVPFAMPLTGLTITEYAQAPLKCVGSCLSVYRLMMADSMAFGEDGMSFNIEHGPDGNNVAANYETCAFYYS